MQARAAAPAHQHVYISPAKAPILLSTANDLVHGATVIVQHILELGENAEPYILDSTPDVLSIGRRCVEKGFSFEWLPYSLSPTLTTPEGVIVTLVSRDCCPYLDDYDPACSVVAPAVLTKEKGILGPTRTALRQAEQARKTKNIR